MMRVCVASTRQPRTERVRFERVRCLSSAAQDDQHDGSCQRQDIGESKAGVTSHLQARWLVDSNALFPSSETKHHELSLTCGHGRQNTIIALAQRGECGSRLIAG
jgi:hypothetical protein